MVVLQFFLCWSINEKIYYFEDFISEFLYKSSSSVLKHHFYQDHWHSKTCSSFENNCDPFWKMFHHWSGQWFFHVYCICRLFYWTWVKCMKLKRSLDFRSELLSLEVITTSLNKTIKIYQSEVYSVMIYLFNQRFWWKCRINILKLYVTRIAQYAYVLEAGNEYKAIFPMKTKRFFKK